MIIVIYIYIYCNGQTQKVEPELIKHTKDATKEDQMYSADYSKATVDRTTNKR